MGIVSEWLEDNFDTRSTKTSYRSHLKGFREFLKETENEEDLEKYIDNIQTEDFVEDFSRFVDYVKNFDLAPKTINDRLTTVKMFFLEHGVEFPEAEWKRLRRRKIPPDTAQTQDRAGKREEWKKILNNLSIEGRSLVLFLLNTGCRIGEALQLKKSDLNLDSEPPEARIRDEYAKNNRPRTVYFTEEAEEAIQNWLGYRERSGLKKKTRLTLTQQEREDLSEEEQKRRLQSLRKMQGKFSESEKIWPIAKRTAYDIFTRALEKADLEERDKQTNRRKLHFHSCRKFFKTHMRGMDEDVVEYLLGHVSGIRGIYRKYEESDIPKEQYEDHCDQLKILEPEAGPSLEKMRDMEIDMLRTTLKTHGIEEAKMDRVVDSFVRKRFPQETMDIVRTDRPLDGLNLGELSKEDYGELKEGLLGLIEKEEPRQRLVEQGELERYLNSGWRYVDQNGEKVIVEKSSGAREPPTKTGTELEETVKKRLEQKFETDLASSDIVDFENPDKEIAIEVVLLRGEGDRSAIWEGGERLSNVDAGWKRVLAVVSAKEDLELESTNIPGIDEICFLQKESL